MGRVSIWLSFEALSSRDSYPSSGGLQQDPTPFEGGLFEDMDRALGARKRTLLTSTSRGQGGKRGFVIQS